LKKDFKIIAGLKKFLKKFSPAGRNKINLDELTYHLKERLREFLEELPD